MPGGCGPARGRARTSTRSGPPRRMTWPACRCILPHAQTMPLYLGRPQADWERDIAYNAHPPTSVLLALPVTGLDLPDAVLG